MSISLKLLLTLKYALVFLSLFSGFIKVLGIRMELMKITQVGFEDWKISIFGLCQIIVALLFFIPKTENLGSLLYAFLYLLALSLYVAYGLSPVIAPIILFIMPIL